jgi:type IV pilus assembly protein PilQ
MFKKLNVYVSMIALGLFSGLANAVTLEDVSFSSLAGDRTEVTLSFDGVPPEPSGYTIERPARIAVDLRDTVSRLESRNISLGSGNAQSMTVVETDDRTRLIFNLAELVPYETVRSQNNLILTIGAEPSGVSSVAATASPTGMNSNETSASSASDQLAGVDFRRGQEGEAGWLSTWGALTFRSTCLSSEARSVLQWTV